VLKLRFLIICFFLLQNLSLHPNSYNSFSNYKTNESKKRNLIIIESSLYAGALISLNQLWYKNYPKSSFHFINDNKSWLQMDKLGHFTTSYYVGVLGIKSYKWAGFSERQSIWLGGMTGTFFQSAIEILDGFSSEWGASSGDLLANSLGSFLAISQALYFHEQKILIKYSFTTSDIANSNPNLFGDSFIQKSLKDYNGQSYWVSFNINNVFKTDFKLFPTWLNIALGHGANNMLSANSSLNNEAKYRKFLFSLDINTNKLNISNKYLKSFLDLFGFIKIPMPTLELSNGNLKFHNFYF
jgi:VanZ family protein|tara:strand:+ start:2435 stop:3328 length:894 start_codon:yes stop_codon:yes gene_type:complete